MTAQSMVELEAAFRDVARDWHRLFPEFGEADERRFDEIKREAIVLVNAGRWTSGPDDLLTIARRHRDELIHSRVLGWLLTPTGRHGLGRTFLTALVEQAWPNEDVTFDGPVVVELEQTQSGVSGQTGLVLEARADIVIHSDSTRLVIENKLDAGEQQAQCERLYWAWANEPIETRWIYLTPTGREPSTASSQIAIDAWRPLSYRQVRQALEAALQARSSNDADMGRASALQYLRTLDTQDR